MLLRLVLIIGVWAGAPLPQAVGVETVLPLERLTLPDGYRLSLYARVPRARSIIAAPELNAIFVGSRGTTIHAVLDNNHDGRSDGVVTVRDDLNVPNGIVWRAPYLYVAEQHRIVRFEGMSLDALRQAKPEIVLDALPDDRWHGWRYAALGPDNMLYVAVGAPCNVCETHGMEGTIIRVNPDGGEKPTLFATGVRNSVGLGFHPESGVLYFTDNGADNMGDDSPPDELNEATAAGHHFGFPFFGGGDHRTPHFKDQTPPATTTMPAVRFGAHVAPLGFDFHRGDAIVAQHGSWNRSVPDGYRLARIPFGADHRPKGTWEPFIEGWLDKTTGEAWGRPVDVLAVSDKVLLISDDRAGAIYRLVAP